MDTIYENNSSAKSFNKRSTLVQQIKALVKRNYLIKIRNRRRTILELMFPLYMIIIIISIKSAWKPKTSDAIDEPIGTGTNWFLESNSVVFPDFRDIQWFIVSENLDNSLLIQSKIISVLKKHTYPDYQQIVFNTTVHTSDEIERLYKLNDENISLAIIFDFKNMANISYTIRMPYISVPNSLKDFGNIGECRDQPFRSSCEEMKYFTSGFTFIQTVVDSALINLLDNTSDYTIPGAKLFIYPKRQYTTDNTMWQSFVPTYLSLAFMPSVSILTLMLVLEKERKIKEAMFMMGLTMTAYWIGWIITQSLLVFVVSLVITILLYFTGIFTLSPVILFLLVFMFGVSMIGIAALISPFFRKEKSAGSFISFFTFIAGFIHLLFVYLDISPVIYYLLSLISPIAFTLGVNSMTRLNEEITFQTLFKDPNFSVGSALLMLIFDTILYTLLAIYLDQVIPGEYGSKQSMFFFLKKSFWVTNKPSLMRNSMNSQFVDQHNDNQSDIEEISGDMKGKVAISIENLTKVYGSGKKSVKAVDNLSFSIYESQITGILGHNGAGKSTLINMLVGNIPVTSGTASIYGLNLCDANDMNRLRQMFGVCLQQDILFDELNAVEHLNFFGQIKGIEAKQLEREVLKLVSEVQLTDDRLTASKKLSGGQKRKLCVAIALIGNPKIILLDEPSSGVDPYSRRQLWSLLESYKKDRVIILSTHFMDEADILADRKAIITKGRLRCVGSSLFLKKRFGIGYHLTVDIKKGRNVDDVNQLIESNLPKAQFDRFTTSEVFYVLPTSETKLFPKLFDALDQNIHNEKQLIKSYGISMTTLEEVFLKIGDEFETESQTVYTNQYTTTITEPISLASIMSDQSEVNPTFWQSFKAFLFIRLLIFIRNPMHAIPIVVLPLIIIIISYFLMGTSNVKDLSPNPILLKPSLYKTNTLLYNNSTDIQIKPIMDQLGVNARSVKNLNVESMNDSYMAVDIINSQKQFDLLFNDTYIHSLPILINLMTNFFYTRDTENPIKSTINTYNHPFPQTDEESVLYTFDGKIFTYVILMAIMLGTIPPTISVEVVEDRESKVKNLLRVCGLSLRQYWFTTLVCHLIMFLISNLLILITTVFIMKIEFLQNSEAIVCVFILFLLFMPTSLITCYVWSHMFDKKDSARAVLPLICYLPGMILVMVVSLVSPNNAEVGKLLHYLFCFVTPFYIPQGALLYIAITSNQIKILSVADIGGQNLSYFDWNQNIDICFIALIFHLFFYSILLIIVDKLKSGESILSSLGFKSRKLHTICLPSEMEDEDVRQERVEVQQYINSGYQTKKPIVLLNELHKRYSKNNSLKCLKKNKGRDKIAVQNTSLLLESGHIMGLLGPNGAGKTTTMKIMICEEMQTQGTVLIDGHPVKASDQEIFKLIGYCPQHDALWREITVREHLRLIAAIRGIPGHRIQKICDGYIDNLKINEHSDKKTEELSGGTKRKLCYLMALLGRPKLVLLDEPSTGMDPKAKRFLWQTILSSFDGNSNRSAVLTTHSMEEADALCTRLAIMIKGVVRCIGSLQHLKNKYGAGYVLEIKWTHTDSNGGASVGHKVKQSIESFFGNSFTAKQELNNRLVIDIDQQSVNSLSKIFTFLEELRESMASIEEYSFSQKTIEQIFIDFAKQQEFDD